MAEYTYIHIPFCRQKCKYCAFVSLSAFGFVEKYINALLCQIETLYDSTPQKTLYFGGGTPSVLPLDKVESIIKKFNFAHAPEITFELNPENASISYMKGLLDLGVNRLSVGLQTFDDEILKTIGRHHTSKEGLKAVEAAYGAGFQNVSVDLMYGLPNQDMKKWLFDLKTVKEISPEHLSTYGLKIEEGTYFWKFPPALLPDEELQAEMYEALVFYMGEYYHYEISNFAKNKNYPSRHNLNYWNLEPYNAFGLAASGFDGKCRYLNSTNMKKYIENPLEIEEKTEINPPEEEIFLKFRQSGGINVSEFNQKYGINFEEKFGEIIKKYLETGHILKTERGYKLSIKGVLVSNYILCDFLW